MTAQGRNGNAPGPRATALTSVAIAPVRHLCTYFDRNYLFRGLALYRSLERHSPAFVLWILCFDDETFDLLSALRLPRARLVRRAEVEAFDPAFAATRHDRSLVEHYWTTSPVLPRFVLAQEPSADAVAYLDGDLYFFGPVEALFDELGGRSILAVEHGFAPEDAHQLKWGRFNVGSLLFRRDAAGERCLARWREQCLAWCRATLEDGKYGDQLYLDEWPALYGDALAVPRRTGIGVAPWNLRRRRIEAGDPPTADGDPIVFVHFHALELLTPRVAWIKDAYPIPRRSKGILYRPYLDAIRGAVGEVRAVEPGFSHGLRGLAPRLVLSGIRRGRLVL